MEQQRCFMQNELQGCSTACHPRFFLAGTSCQLAREDAASELADCTTPAFATIKMKKKTKNLHLE